MWEMRLNGGYEKKISDVQSICFGQKEMKRKKNPVNDSINGYLFRFHSINSK